MYKQVGRSFGKSTSKVSRAVSQAKHSVKKLREELIELSNMKVAIKPSCAVEVVPTKFE
jgi:hypothetical protein